MDANKAALLAKEAEVNQANMEAAAALLNKDLGGWYCYILVEWFAKRVLSCFTNFTFSCVLHIHVEFVKAAIFQ